MLPMIEKQYVYSSIRLPLVLHGLFLFLLGEKAKTKGVGEGLPGGVPDYFDGVYGFIPLD